MMDKEKPGSLPVKKRRGDPSRFPTKGRPKGTPNKFTELRSSFLSAFDKTGGVESLVAWASQSDNREAFYKMVISLLPKQLDVEQKGGENFTVNIVRYDAGGGE